MENKFILTDDLLWDYADGFLDGAEKARVDAYLQKHPEWQTRLQHILDEKQALAAMPLENPGPGFTDRVMAAWAAEQASVKTAGNKDWVIRLIVLAFAFFVLTPVMVMVVAALQLGPVELPAIAWPELPATDWAGFLSGPILLNGLLLLAAVFSLQLLDKFLQHQKMTQKPA